jgi:myo-inositol-1(or 4)-monophosphatase
VLATGIPFLGHGQHAKFLKELHQISQRVAGVRRFGAASLDLAWVAAGRFDGYWERDLKPGTSRPGAAGHGGRRQGHRRIEEHGNPAEGSSILAANQDLHPLVLEKLRLA